jgi:hypothetical protein
MSKTTCAMGFISPMGMILPAQDKGESSGFRIRAKIHWNL